MKSVIKSFKVLEAFSLEKPELAFTEVVKITGLGRTNVHKLLKTLVSLNCLAQDNNGGALSTWANAVRAWNPLPSPTNLRRVAMPYIST